MIKLSDFVARFLVENGIQNLYLVSGGGIMHLLDSVGRQKGLRYFCNHHEQASAICAESEARLTGRVAACLGTTGPGSTNLLSGVVGAWYDSVPLLAISGQVRTQILADYSQLRQMGPQEVNIGPMARPVTKYFVTIKDASTIRYELEKALYLAQEGRPGPVWIDVPLDMQSAMIDDSALAGFTPPAADVAAARARAKAGAAEVMARLAGAKRPLILCGNGVHLGRAEREVRLLAERLGIPVVATIGALDILPESHPQLMGKIGPVGQRRANFALQNADLLLGLGASFSLASLGFNVAEFAARAKKIMVNIDGAELTKPSFTPALGVRADVKAFCEEALAIAPAAPITTPRWRAACVAWKTKYPSITPDYFEDKTHANSYVFADVLSDLHRDGDVVVTGNSLDIVSVYQAWKVKEGQRLYTNINYGAMGWDLPGAIGACAGRGYQRVTLITGDGSIMLNLHELAQISHARLPIKIFLLTNEGYQSIRATQQNFFQGFLVGSSSGTGVGIPDARKLAAAFDLPFARIGSNDEIRDVAAKFLAEDGPGLCEVALSPLQERTPRVKSFRREDGTMESRSLEDMFPYLPREEVFANMHQFDDDP